MSNNTNNSKKCKYDYGFEALTDDEVIWQRVNCSKPLSNQTKRM